MGEGLEDFPVQEVVEGEDGNFGALGHFTAIEKWADKLFPTLVPELVEHHGP
jgi:hypothetical protein